MLRVLGLTLLLTLSGYAIAEPIADTHSEMSGCESCHVDSEPSADLDYENGACVECHGFLKEFADETHQKHFEILACSDCHLAHDEANPNDSCAKCH
ncbi:cytochrome c3 family protein [Shewanella eurypsychrophilus]|uniref:Cytochrome c3 family protein n=1 Tax=Shewanella eurypsychrophilus TaxID=2593656 RepID=A0ABX6V2M3_9GAMM|nr:MULTISPECIES: cytochrome c3 family protein [Shewanella]QFU21245.1 cytochrome C [Shewanella sp. YLB-09]QPG56536.1 cytochrome c3 family protein [Shewanella eurypsychrophilus]